MKAIETLYKGYRFRSRLEARWAVFLDTVHIRWEYEKEGYDLDGLWYLPDFWLPELKCWLEIKAEQPTEEECTKAMRLTFLTQMPVFILWGELEPFWQEDVSPITMEESMEIFNATGEYVPFSDLQYRGTLGHGFFPREAGNVHFSDTFYHFGICPLCQKIGIWFLGQPHNGCGTEGCACGYKEICVNAPLLVKAYAAARQARFEHNENLRRY